MADGSAHAALRGATREDHERVDAAFAGFNLKSRCGYAAFLRAHASVLPELERQLAPGQLIHGWAGREAALKADLADLAQPMPSPASIDLPTGTAARWGALYVVEGSRLGGALLARLVGDGLPSVYLRSTHGPGDWHRTLAMINRTLQNPQDLADAVNAAKAVFVAYRQAAEREHDVV